MDVIGNNIANVNTTGYKTSRVIFQDIFSQTVSGGKANTAISGGTNPMQIGLGIKLSTVDVLHTAAPLARTDNPFDMMVSGDGFFIVETPEGNLYTRAGNFKLDDEGWLTTSDGYYVLGYAGDLSDYYIPAQAATDDKPAIPPHIDFGDKDDDDYEPFEIVYDEGLMRIRLRVDGTAETDKPVDLVGFAVGDDGSVSVIINNEKVVIAKIALAMFSNPGGLEKAGNSMYRVTASSGDVVETLPQENGAGVIKGGGLEMSNVDLATEFTDMIVTQRGFQANSRIITVSDTLLEELVNLKR